MFYETQNNQKTELQAKKQFEKRSGYKYSLKLKRGMKIWAINKETLEVSLAHLKYSMRESVEDRDGFFARQPKNKHFELHAQKGFAYVPAINAKNALRKYKKQHD